MDQAAEDLRAVAAEAFAALGNARQIPPFSSRPQGLSVDDAYRVTPLVRQMYEAGGAKPIAVSSEKSGVARHSTSCRH